MNNDVDDEKISETEPFLSKSNHSLQDTTSNNNNYATNNNDDDNMMITSSRRIMDNEEEEEIKYISKSFSGERKRIPFTIVATRDGSEDEYRLVNKKIIYQYEHEKVHIMYLGCVFGNKIMEHEEEMYEDSSEEEEDGRRRIGYDSSSDEEEVDVEKMKRRQKIHLVGLMVAAIGFCACCVFLFLVFGIFALLYYVFYLGIGCKTWSFAHQNFDYDTQKVCLVGVLVYYVVLSGLAIHLILIVVGCIMLTLGIVLVIVLAKVDWKGMMKQDSVRALFYAVMIVFDKEDGNFQRVRLKTDIYKGKCKIPRVSSRYSTRAGDFYEDDLFDGRTMIDDDWIEWRKTYHQEGGIFIKRGKPLEVRIIERDRMRVFSKII